MKTPIKSENIADLEKLLTGSGFERAWSPNAWPKFRKGDRHVWIRRIRKNTTSKGLYRIENRDGSAAPEFLENLEA